jgi:hypothetical protein
MRYFAILALAVVSACQAEEPKPELKSGPQSQAYLQQERVCAAQTDKWSKGPLVNLCASVRLKTPANLVHHRWTVKGTALQMDRFVPLECLTLGAMKLMKTAQRRPYVWIEL